MSITASMVKELRERTGAAMMDCKKALVETQGDMEAAVELMRKKGMANADKKADRTAADGLIEVKVSADGKVAAIVEVNCETDFVAKGDDFKGFVEKVTDVVLNHKTTDLETISSAVVDGETLDEARRALIAKIGENVSIRRAELVQTTGSIATYKHGERIGVVVSLEQGALEAGRDVAMHVAATNPAALSSDAVSPELIEKEKEIFTAQALESGKPAEIVEKMIGGRIAKFLKEVSLMDQAFVKNPDQTVAQMLKEAQAVVAAFVRFEVGEGIEKKVDNFAEEVAAQAAAAKAAAK
jgi:elongation factor Ts